MTWIEYDYLCNESKGILYHKKVEYNEANLAIAQQEAHNGNYTITEDEEVIESQPLAIELGGTNAKTAEEACKNVGGINTYVHSANGLSGMGSNGKFKATTSGAISAIKVNGVNRLVKCGEESSMDLVAGCWYTFILDGNTVNFNSGGAGGGGLNFAVVGNPQPASPKENTIWVNTDAEITSWIFSASESENPTEGMVWFPTATSSYVEFNALKKNGITVYPLSAKQYVSGAWVDKTAKSYQGGAWVDLINPDVAKIFEVTEVREAGDGEGGVTIDGRTITFTTIGPTSQSQAHVVFYSSEMIDLTNYSTFTFTGVRSERGQYWNVGFCKSNKECYNWKIDKAAHITPETKEKTLAIDVSALSGNYYFYANIACGSGGGTTTMTLSDLLFS